MALQLFIKSPLVLCTLRAHTLHSCSAHWGHTHCTRALHIEGTHTLHSCSAHWGHTLCTRSLHNYVEILPQARPNDSNFIPSITVYRLLFFQVYCEMGLNGGGYTFINPRYLPQFSNRDIQSWFTDTASFLMRVRSSDGTQPYSVLSQLVQYTYVTLNIK